MTAFDVNNVRGSVRTISLSSEQQRLIPRVLHRFWLSYVCSKVQLLQEKRDGTWPSGTCRAKHSSGRSGRKQVHSYTVEPGI